ncbi:methyltransferase, FxLD system [Myceligenerans crystallogenes]|uniref:Protein-L-isoaspartate O-methyltransferase n=1 Tax=Myceligenerans crystallogenes TaxID=316335 RepID=A0ABN2NN34_9MICO
MTQTQSDSTAATTAVPDVTVLREQMVAELIESGVLTDPRIEAAFRAVPREVFAPEGTSAQLPYTIHDIVRTRFAADGSTVSSLSAPYMQAGNLAQACVEPGQRVLEIGSGGPLAAMLAHLVGPDGQVVTVDIDADVTARTQAGLEQLGLTDRVEVVTADAADRLGRGMFDRIIVAVAAWTIPEVWLEQLRPDGVIVVPLQIAPGSQRILGFRRDGEKLVAESVVLGGFVPMQGTHQHPRPRAVLTGPSGGDVAFEFADAVPDQFAVSDDVLASEPVEAWSEVTYRNGQVWVDILTWIGTRPGGCSITAESKSDIGRERSFYPCLTDGTSYAAIAMRPRPDDDDHVQVGAVGKGPNARQLTVRFVGEVTVYDQRHRRFDPKYTWWPSNLTPPEAGPTRTVIHRPHGTLVIDWLDIDTY